MKTNEWRENEREKNNVENNFIIRFTCSRNRTHIETFYQCNKHEQQAMEELIQNWFIKYVDI